MLYHKIAKCKKVGKAYAQKEIDRRVNKFFIYYPYRQNLRYSMQAQSPNKLELQKHEINYRLLRRYNYRRLKKTNDVRSSLPRFNARCSYTGKDKVHNRWFRISTVPLRMMLRENLIPGWERANW
eukprot:338733_1